MFERAYRLWKAFRTETPAYRAIAEKMGLSVGQLNARCSYHRQALEAAARQARRP